jgi:hypothetical protein
VVKGAISDHAEHDLATDAWGEGRKVRLRVAGPAALLVAKAYKLADRLAGDRRDRVIAKDAVDAYRLLRLPMSVLVSGFERTAPR